jgi:hypothetical protein
MDSPQHTIYWCDAARIAPYVVFEQADFSVSVTEKSTSNQPKWFGKLKIKDLRQINFFQPHFGPFLEGIVNDLKSQKRRFFSRPSVAWTPAAGKRFWLGNDPKLRLKNEHPSAKFTLPSKPVSTDTVAKTEGWLSPVEGTRLEIERRLIPYRGFESHPFRHIFRNLQKSKFPFKFR